MQVTPPAGLPAPDPDSAAHSRRCADYISDRIREAGGSISFAEYMHHALYAPGLGYYVAGNRKFGPAGDFVTAPEISPLFGRVLALQCAGILETTGGSILEIGAGSGRLAIDILQKLDEISVLPDEYLVLEVSPELAVRQRAAIATEVPHLAGRVRWLAELPDAHVGVILGNEVADALPCEIFEAGDVPKQRRVARNDAGFDWITADAPAALAEAVAGIERDLGCRLAEGYRSEVVPAAAAFTGDLVTALESGAIFLFDYGLERRAYYSADRDRGWLRCHFRHHAHDDPLVLPGIQDITTWVDFSAIAHAGVDAGARLAGYLPQAQFLLEGGLVDELEQLSGLSTSERMSLSGQVKTLTLPGEMGERFKCLALTRGLPMPPAVFRRADRAQSL